LIYIQESLSHGKIKRAAYTRTRDKATDRKSMQDNGENAPVRARKKKTKVRNVKNCDCESQIVWLQHANTGQCNGPADRPPPKRRKLAVE
jgi:hypothetical protein